MNSSRISFLLLFISQLIVSAAISQEKYRLRILLDDNVNQNFPVQANENVVEFKSDKMLKKNLTQLIFKAYRAGFLAASVDCLLVDSMNYTAYVHAGHQYKWAQLRQGNVEDGILSEIHFRDKVFRHKPVDPGQFTALMENILTYCENNGFPFANVGLDSVSFKGKQLEAALFLQKNKFIVIDSIRILGKANVAPVYIANYIGIKQGSAYNESKINKISIRIKELPFLTEQEPAKIIFTEEHTKLYLHLMKRKSSNFNGIIGVLPNEQTGKILITGDARIRLLNALHHGETIELNWRKIQDNTQELKSAFVYPFLLSTPFGLDLSLQLYRKDTLYSTVSRSFGFQYLLKGGNYFKAFITQDNSNLISTAGLAHITTLPVYADIHTLSYGMGLKTERLDYRLNPRRGVMLSFTGSVGNKVIEQNPGVNPEIYDSIELKTIHYKADLDFDLFVPFFRRTTLDIGIISGWVQDENLFENELYRIGGFQTIRGFDEEIIRASLFSVLTLEYRYLLEQNSYAYLFFDGAYYENTSVSARVFDRPFGFGAGVSFETKVGIFSISYALGKQFDNPLLFKTAKVHFGFVNFF